MGLGEREREVLRVISDNWENDGAANREKTKRRRLMGKHRALMVAHVESGVLMGHLSEDECLAGSIP